MSNHQFTRPEGTGGKSILGSDDKTPLNDLEKNALGNLDEDKLNELAKCLFTLNNRRYFHGCAKMTLYGRTILVVAGGFGARLPS